MLALSRRCWRYHHGVGPITTVLAVSPRCWPYHHGVGGITTVLAVSPRCWRYHRGVGRITTVLDLPIRCWAQHHGAVFSGPWLDCGHQTLHTASGARRRRRRRFLSLGTARVICRRWFFFLRWLRRGGSGAGFGGWTGGLGRGRFGRLRLSGLRRSRLGRGRLRRYWLGWRGLRRRWLLRLLRCAWSGSRRWRGGSGRYGRRGHHRRGCARTRVCARLRRCRCSGRRHRARIECEGRSRVGIRSGDRRKRLARSLNGRRHPGGRSFLYGFVLLLCGVARAAPPPATPRRDHHHQHHRIDQLAFHFRHLLIGRNRKPLAIRTARNHL